MTFSLLGHCARTGQFGAVCTTSSIGIGARVPFLAARQGGVLTQHRTDPRLGPRGLDLLRSGCTAQETVAALAASTPDHGWRQLAVIDRAGRTAHFHGARMKPAFAEAHGAGCVAIGNIMASADVPRAMIDAFLARPEAPLATRLLEALQAGEDAGGEGRPLVSAALVVVAEESFPYVDLRVDRDAAPIVALAALWRDYAPQADEYVLRAVAPDAARGG
ncbi:DUF1028 domain-containing protein [Roseomonas marmotae]|uniref:DUF1028 domain-containing protein n=1 Tax=Roseomonas marmotae TaxID=2768161 RepID=A0ABS3KGQ6_9PROT|nr:DUF1028 domain-containing protein [Roseomonas marmotae]MBO1076644.1 DUF1028 domain-containing protein [Roseomonas marmotae]QTI79615.1 DUF1028 domain-containing protein [Roseomonas marmotae]